MAIGGSVPRLTRCVAALRPSIQSHRPRSVRLSARSGVSCSCYQSVALNRCPASTASLHTTRHLSDGGARVAARQQVPDNVPTSDDTANLAAKTKHVFAAYPQPICLVLARDTTRASTASHCHPDASRGSGGRGDGGGDVRGMTISSLTSLSLDPPLVTFNVKLPSRAYDAMLAASQPPNAAGAAAGFAVHFLGQTDLEVAMARHYAGIPPTSTRSPEDHLARHVEHDATGVPMLRPEASAGAVLRCVIDRSIQVADHAIVVARIEQVVRPASTADVGEQSRQPARGPLVYHRHAFTTIKTKDR